MFHSLKGVLTSEELATACRILEQGKFVEGAPTARGPAGRRKANLQLDRRTAPPSLAELDRLLVDALCRCEEFNRTVLPRRFSVPLYARYSAGMEYGLHVDSGLMGVGSPAPVRADMAILGGTSLKLTLGNRGRIDTFVKVKGSPGHSSAPHRACNAITGALEIIRRLEDQLELTGEHPALGTPTFAVNHIRSGPDATHTIQGPRFI